MKETAHKLKSLTAFDISGDYLIGGLFIPSPIRLQQIAEGRNSVSQAYGILHILCHKVCELHGKILSYF